MTKKKSWNRGEKIATWTVVVMVILILPSFFVPEVRQFLRLEKSPVAPTAAAPSNTLTHDLQPQKQDVQARSTQSLQPSQRAKTSVKGNSNVASGNISGSANVVGTSNQTAPVAIAPNGIAITGGNVQNPTVNNFGPPPVEVTWSVAEGDASPEFPFVQSITLKVKCLFCSSPHGHHL